MRKDYNFSARRLYFTNLFGLVSDNSGTAAASCTEGAAVDVGEGPADLVALPRDRSADSEALLPLPKLPPITENTKDKSVYEYSYLQCCLVYRSS